MIFIQNWCHFRRRIKNWRKLQFLWLRFKNLLIRIGRWSLKSINCKLLNMDTQSMITLTPRVTSAWEPISSLTLSLLQRNPRKDCLLQALIYLRLILINLEVVPSDRQVLQATWVRKRSLITLEIPRNLWFQLGGLLWSLIPTRFTQILRPKKHNGRKRNKKSWQNYKNCNEFKNSMSKSWWKTCSSYKRRTKTFSTVTKMQWTIT